MEVVCLILSIATLLSIACHQYFSNENGMEIIQSIHLWQQEKLQGKLWHISCDGQCEQWMEIFNKKSKSNLIHIGFGSKYIPYELLGSITELMQTDVCTFGLYFH